MKILPFYRFFALLAVLTFGAQDGRAATFPINNAVITGTSSISGVLTNSASETIFNTHTLSSGASIVGVGSISLSGGLTGGSLTTSDGIINTPGGGGIGILNSGDAWALSGSATITSLSYGNFTFSGNTTITGGGTINLNGSTLTIPTTGTVGILTSNRRGLVATRFLVPARLLVRLDSTMAAP